MLPEERVDAHGCREAECCSSDAGWYDIFEYGDALGIVGIAEEEEEEGLHGQEESQFGAKDDAVYSKKEQRVSTSFAIHA